MRMKVLFFTFQRPSFGPTSASVHEVHLVSEHTDQTLALLNFPLNFIAGGGDLGLCGQDSAEEAGQRSSYRCVERPAQRAQGRLEGRRLRPAVAVHLLRTPACGVQHEAHHEQQSWREERAAVTYT